MSTVSSAGTAALAPSGVADASQFANELRAVGYHVTAEVAGMIGLAAELEMPLLVEGPAGSGKTELAKAIADVRRARLIRLQCHEGLDDGSLLYEWNYHKQVLRLQFDDAHPGASDIWRGLADDIYTDEYLVERPLMAALRSDEPVVLLVDEVDRLGFELEALLLEYLSGYEITVPEQGNVVSARTVPTVVLTSNGTRTLSDGLRRRCLVIQLDYPDADNERAAILQRVPGVVKQLAAQVDDALRGIGALGTLEPIRRRELADWARVVAVLGVDAIGHDTARAVLSHIRRCETDPTDVPVVVWGSDAVAHGHDDRRPDAPENGLANLILDMVSTLVEELRSAGIEISIGQHLDAVHVLQHVELLDRETVKASLAAALTTSHQQWDRFAVVFDAYFSLSGVEHRRHRHHHEHEHDDEPDERDARLAQLLAHAAAHTRDRDTGLDEMTPEQIADMIFRSILGGERESWGPLASAAVERFGDLQTAGPIAYYLYKTLRGLDIEAMLERLVAESTSGADGVRAAGLDAMLERDEMAERVRELRVEIEAEIRRRVVVASGLAPSEHPLLPAATEDVDFALASRDELEQIIAAMQPLARKLTARWNRQRRHRGRGRLDIRNTVRHSMSYGGVLAEPQFKRRRPVKSDVVVLADISGSVAAFSRFTLHFVYAMSSSFSRVRTFVFVDGIQEVTDLLQSEPDVVGAVERIITETPQASIGGCSDYGRVLTEFRDQQLAVLTKRTSLLILGDARSNFSEPNSPILNELASRVRTVVWLNPEPDAYWDTRDSVAAEYAPHCEMHECRNLRQLEAVADLLA